MNPLVVSPWRGNRQSGLGLNEDGTVLNMHAQQSGVLHTVIILAAHFMRVIPVLSGCKSCQKCPNLPENKPDPDVQTRGLLPDAVHCCETQLLLLRPRVPVPRREAGVSNFSIVWNQPSQPSQPSCRLDAAQTLLLISL